MVYYHDGILRPLDEYVLLGQVSGELQKIIDELKATGIEQNLFSIYKTSTKENQENLDPMFYAF